MDAQVASFSACSARTSHPDISAHCLISLDAVGASKAEACIMRVLQPWHELFAVRMCYSCIAVRMHHLP